MPLLSTPKRRRNDGRAWREPNEPVSLHVLVGTTSARWIAIRGKVVHLHAEQQRALQEDDAAEQQIRRNMLPRLDAHVGGGCEGGRLVGE